MKSTAELLELYYIIDKHFSIKDESGVPDKIISDGVGSIHKRLTDRLFFLMNSNYEKLMQVLIRIDVNEFKLKKAFKENVFDDMPPIIADLVIERQIIKAQMRTSMREETE
jgi:hypothetical protein